MKIRHVTVASALLAGLVAAPAQAAPVRSAPVLSAEQAVADSYIVVLKRHDDLAALAAAPNVTFTYRTALPGFALRATAAQARRLAADPRVAYIAQDAHVRLTARDLSPRPAPAARGVVAQGLVVQPDPPSWGLDRIDQRSLPLDRKYFHPNTASTVRAYIFGTGIRYTHQEFDGAAVPGLDTIGGVTPPGNDCNGHGTHMAGTVGGRTTGVAKDVTLVSVRVLNCQGSGTYSQIIAGIDWATRDAAASGRPAVALMTLGGGPNQAFNDAITASINANVHYSVVSGSSNANACGYSPGSTPLATTVGATDVNDAKASFSNYGSCIDVWAPGVNITSAWGTTDTAYSTISGSTASAHAAGVAALWRHRFPGDPAVAVAEALRANATPGVITNPGTGSPNLLLFMGMVPV
ncbi:subtilisin family serine protease [Saccharothrix carnea]|uniref:Subtilisin family serine protease n=1 Tax=Saccharothrix carnea TaxID=1280637 RepID=A0A2P8I650_SACCR|nr:S8 family peptidase [Saccharothrix carnea]PSL53945.1 subtilisin family serine protease [Saccharothrix carnea]